MDLDAIGDRWPNAAIRHHGVHCDTSLKVKWTDESTAESAGTVEYAVQCADGQIRNTFRTFAGAKADAARFDRYLPDRTKWGGCKSQRLGCGPHRVVSRTVTAWEPVDV